MTSDCIEKSAALGLLGAVATIAGLILVFCGFLFARAETFATARGDKYKRLAKLGVVPLFAAFCSAWTSTSAATGNPWAMAHSMLLFKTALVLSALYSIFSLISL